jgi:peptidyl-prolyl isomerase H (cyclophilin H)
MKSVHLSAQYQLSDPKNDVVFFDISIADVPQGRLIVEILGKTQATENFRQLCTGEYRLGTTPQGYKSSKFHMIGSDLLFGGDYLNSDGSGCLSIYGRGFKAQSTIQHS